MIWFLPMNLVKKGDILISNMIYFMFFIVYRWSCFMFFIWIVYFFYVHHLYVCVCMSVFVFIIYKNINRPFYKCKPHLGVRAYVCQNKLARKKFCFFLWAELWSRPFFFICFFFVFIYNFYNLFIFFRYKCWIFFFFHYYHHQLLLLIKTFTNKFIAKT